MHFWDFVSGIPSADKSGGWLFAAKPCFASTDVQNFTARLKQGACDGVGARRNLKRHKKRCVGRTARYKKGALWYGFHGGLCKLAFDRVFMNATSDRS